MKILISLKSKIFNLNFALPLLLVEFFYASARVGIDNECERANQNFPSRTHYSHSALMFRYLYKEQIVSFTSSKSTRHLSVVNRIYSCKIQILFILNIPKIIWYEILLRKTKFPILIIAFRFHFSKFRYIKHFKRNE